jgi:hypothetical protein
MESKQIIAIIAAVIVVAALFFYCAKNTDKPVTKETLAQYGQTPSHPKFKRVVIMIDGCSGDLDKTINSALNQSVRVSEIATGVEKNKCDISQMCASVLNHYDDPYNKGTVKSTFEREMEADTIVAFVKRGYVFPEKDSLKQLLDQWTAEKPVKTPNVSVMSANQC